jgi:hypothetical protein
VLLIQFVGSALPFFRRARRRGRYCRYRRYRLTSETVSYSSCRHSFRASASQPIRVVGRFVEFYTLRPVGLRCPFRRKRLDQQCFPMTCMNRAPKKAHTKTTSTRHLPQERAEGTKPTGKTVTECRWRPCLRGYFYINLPGTPKSSARVTSGTCRRLPSRPQNH